MPNPSPSPQEARGSIKEVLLVFLRLGCTSFGGPVAHLGYFQKEIVERRRWCGEERLAELIALAQSLPGPASSQVVFALGVLRAGWLGGVAAWIGFTLPSALLMLGLRVRPFLSCWRHRGMVDSRAAARRRRSGGASCFGDEESACAGPGTHDFCSGRYGPDLVCAGAVRDSDCDYYRGGRWAIVLPFGG